MEMPAVPPRPSAPPPPPLAQAVDLRVQKRLLWVGEAAYPLHNIARVFTFVLRPRRKEAIALFCKRVALSVSTATGFTVLIWLTTSLASLGQPDDGGGGGGLISFVWIVTLATLVYFLTELTPVLTARSHFVLAVETSGQSTAMVTSADPNHLRQLVGHISYAIDHPEAEFTVRVEGISASPQIYHFGDNINMYGGSGNVGIANS
ncbi:DUF6232 family protein [Streptomyces sp. HB132]|uniref:DUF6232 family protein n=1 Tax=Streptomyces sp. HB132 TaxID=767388 RepID=UPI001D644972|nr:DUF6232 family protein [Streptomyces sp. HB132]MBM7441568.1 hypothetical protein [Streptomyces sp. HB132]